MRIGVLFSPNAGMNNEFKSIGKMLEKKLSEHNLLTLQGEFGEEYLPKASVFVSEHKTDYIKNIYAQIRALASVGIDVLICIGGDGLATYAANSLYQINLQIPILGIAGGSANVGPIIHFKIEEIMGIDIEHLVKTSFDGIQIWIDDEFISYGFNDIVIGSTFLGTFNQKMMNLSVTELCENNRLVPCKPSTEIIEDDFTVRLNGRIIEYSNLRIAQIIITTIQMENHYGRAIYGPLGVSKDIDKNGVINLSDSIIVTFDENDEGISKFWNCSYLLFGENDEIELSGFSKSACVICDGNPYLLNQRKLIIKYVKNAVCGLR